jgi:hypothetical protein
MLFLVWKLFWSVATAVSNKMAVALQSLENLTLHMAISIHDFIFLT